MKTKKEVVDAITAQWEGRKPAPTPAADASDDSDDDTEALAEAAQAFSAKLPLNPDLYVEIEISIYISRFSVSLFAS